MCDSYISRDKVKKSFYLPSKMSYEGIIRARQDRDFMGWYQKVRNLARRSGGLRAYITFMPTSRLVEYLDMLLSTDVMVANRVVYEYDYDHPDALLMEAERQGKRKLVDFLLSFKTEDDSSDEEENDYDEEEIISV